MNIVNLYEMVLNNKGASMSFRLAEMIELHDAKLFIKVHHLNDELVGWDINPAYTEITSIKGDALATIINSLNPGGGFSGSFTYQFFPILRKQYISTDAEKWHIHRLLAEPRSERLLNLKAVISFETAGPPESITTCFHVADLTYCGAYTVWWDTTEDHVTVKRHGKLTLEQINKIINRITDASIQANASHEHQEHHD
jgi:hypothetical protein